MVPSFIAGSHEARQRLGGDEGRALLAELHGPVGGPLAVHHALAVLPARELAAAVVEGLREPEGAVVSGVSPLVVLPPVVGRREARGHRVEHLLHGVPELVGHGPVHPDGLPRPDELEVGGGLAVVWPERVVHVHLNPHLLARVEHRDGRRGQTHGHLARRRGVVDGDVRGRDVP